MTVDDMIETMVKESYGHADLRTQHMFRTQLQVLIVMANRAQAMENAPAMPGEYSPRGTMH